VSQDRSLHPQAAFVQPSAPLAPPILAPSLPGVWALACGALTAGLGPWSGLTVFRLLASWLVADIAMGCVWTQLGALKASERRTAVVSGPELRGPLVVPYAEPGSPGELLATRLNDYVGQFAGEGRTRLAQPALAALLAAGIALVLATFVGRSSLEVTGGALVLAVLVSILSGSATLQREWAGGLRAGAAWLLGRAALGPWGRWDWLPVLLVSLWGCAQVRGERANGRLGLGLARLAYAGAIALLLAFRQPYLAVGVALAGTVAEWAAVARPRWRASVPWLASSLLLALAAPWWA
jgi:hypothetical protein